MALLRKRLWQRKDKGLDEALSGGAFPGLADRPCFEDGD
jgi:hypothetical protein